MMLLFRILIAIALIAFLVPLGRNPAGQPGEAVSPVAALAAAGAAVNDMRGFCERQPGACDVGARALQAMGERARAGAQALQQFVTEQQGSSAPAAHPPADEPVPSIPVEGKTMLTDMLNLLAQGNGAARPPSQPQPAGDAHDTLLPEDRQPAWQKPNLKPGRG